MVSLVSGVQARSSVENLRGIRLVKRFVSILTLAIISLNAYSTSVKPGVRTLYRVVQTSPKDFLYALSHNVPTDKTKSPEQPNHSGKSRLLRYFMVMQKEASGGHLRVVIRIDDRHIPEAFVRYTEFTLILDELPPLGKTQRHQLKFELAGNAEINALMSVTNYGQDETLLRLDIGKSTLPDWLLDKFLLVITRLNLASNRPTR